MKKDETDKKDKDKGEVLQSNLTNRARLIINVPVGAKLYIDDRLSKSTSERRTFSTPDLNKGDVYYYELRVELVRDGETFTENKKVTLTAGDVIRADFREIEKTATARLSKK